MREGVSLISHRLVEANNPLLKDYDPQKPTSWITYLDSNNLYGGIMTHYKLPVNGFRWLTQEEIDSFEPMEYDPEASYAYEVDLTDPPELHGLHNDLPLAAEKVKLDSECLSPFQIQLQTAFNDQENGRINSSNNEAITPKFRYTPTTKLIPNLRNKTKYILHIRNLMLYIELGMELTKFIELFLLDNHIGSVNSFILTHL